jgi:hypothetical protein
MREQINEALRMEARDNPAHGRLGRISVQLLASAAIAAVKPLAHFCSCASLADVIHEI